MDARTPILLDLDESVLPLTGAHAIARQGWQDTLRFACRRRDLARFSHEVLAQLPAQHGTVMLGSGDYHHLSLPLIERLHGRPPFQLVVLDNHPDNMRFPFGMHCGSWVHAAAALPQVAHVHVLGITSNDIGLAHAWENHWAPLRKGQLTYWCTDVDVRWASRFGLGHAFRRFDTPEALVATFAAEQARRPQPTYLSIDKDVFSPSVIRSNWDQGRFLRRDALQVIAALRAGGLVGSDITGEVSQYTYRSRFKRLLSSLDGQPDIPSATLADWQQQHQRVNRELLRAIAELPVHG
ncbi:arginase family protein [Stenotrophomonas sp. 24(2023)]|uniref:arginase family protein n=1 Tax=Stenotrophomonas sp. 24(2023) TaxID=3068324 RepID=UPI0027DEB5AD|nr:arginase family protein [Stenotrophomonas sp. 24(2023)]WMJ68406.1 arginase family protein [Stenotrophomonas sp. 24(2023)]